MVLPRRNWSLRRDKTMVTIWWSRMRTRDPRRDASKMMKLRFSVWCAKSHIKRDEIFWYYTDTVDVSSLSEDVEIFVAIFAHPQWTVAVILPETGHDNWGTTVSPVGSVLTLRVEMSWHEFVLVKYTTELACRLHVTRFASTMPLLTSSLPGQAQDMPPRCLHMSALLCRLLVGNSTGINLDEPMRTLKNID